MKIKVLLLIGLTASLAVGCRTALPPVASPVAHGPPGPTPELPTDPHQSGPPPAPIGEDHAVASAVRADLRQDPALAGVYDRIHVKVNKGVLTLRGTLPPGVDREALLTRIAKLPGVDRIEDKLRLSGQ